MVKLTKIYTRTGDDGQTQLAGGHSISKSSEQIAAIGNIDELNAWIGLCAALTQTPTAPKFANMLTDIQHQLFNLGCDIAVLKPDQRPDTPTIQAGDVSVLEIQIDDMNKSLPPLNSFILPGGSQTVAQIHICRTVCRRAERQINSLGNEIKLNPIILKYINRLSDWLFVFARYWAQHENTDECLWTPATK